MLNIYKAFDSFWEVLGGLYIKLMQRNAENVALKTIFEFIKHKINV